MNVEYWCLLFAAVEMPVTQRVVFRHKRFGRKSMPSSSSDVTAEISLKLPDEQNTDIQILSPLTVSPSDSRNNSRPGSSQDQYPDLASQMEPFYQIHDYPGSRRNSKVLSWISDGRDAVFEDTGSEQRLFCKHYYGL